MTLHADERLTFDMYFASLASMQLHPGSGTRDHVALSLEECSDMALKMIEIRRQITHQENP